MVVASISSKQLLVLICEALRRGQAWPPGVCVPGWAALPKTGTWSPAGLLQPSWLLLVGRSLYFLWSEEAGVEAVVLLPLHFV